MPHVPHMPYVLGVLGRLWRPGGIPGPCARDTQGAGAIQGTGLTVAALVWYGGTCL